LSKLEDLAVIIGYNTSNLRSRIVIVNSELELASNMLIYPSDNNRFKSFVALLLGSTFGIIRILLLNESAINNPPSLFIVIPYG